MKQLPILIFSILLIGNLSAQIQIQWVDSIEGDFSFVQDWSYNEGVYVNRHGQLSCDGLCPPETDRLKDSEGRLIYDSLKKFYEIIDTSHFNHTIKCEAVAHEFAGINFIFCKRMGEGCNCFTPGSVGTHSSLDLTFINDSCSAFIDLVSIMPDSDQIFELIEGWIKIDKSLYSQGKLKASFDLKFKDETRPERPLEWKGLICTKIEKN